MITLMSASRSMAQMSRLYAVRSMIGIPVVKTENLLISDRTVAVPPSPKISFSDSELVPMGNPDLSRFSSVSISA